MSGRQTSSFSSSCGRESPVSSSLLYLHNGQALFSRRGQDLRTLLSLCLSADLPFYASCPSRARKWRQKKKSGECELLSHVRVVLTGSIFLCGAWRELETRMTKSPGEKYEEREKLPLLSSFLPSSERLPSFSFPSVLSVQRVKTGLAGGERLPRTFLIELLHVEANATCEERHPQDEEQIRKDAPKHRSLDHIQQALQRDKKKEEKTDLAEKRQTQRTAALLSMALSYPISPQHG